MAIITGGVTLGGFIAPSDSTDNYPVTDSQYGLGGWHEVADADARNAIPAKRRREGMAVYVSSTDQTWVLKDGILDANWVLLNGQQRDITFVLRGNLQEIDPATSEVVVAKAGVVLGARIAINTAPTGRSAVFSIKKNTSEIATISVADGALVGTVSAFSATAVAPGDSFTLGITNVGSTTPGGWAIITLTIRYFT